MKKVLFNVALACSLLLPLSLMAQPAGKADKAEPKFKKTKSYAKSYTLTGSDKLSLNNQFGEMKLVTWDKNEIKVEVSISGKSDEEKRAQEILDRISIVDGREGNTVYFKTKLADNDKDHDKNNNKGHRNEGMDINYLVHLPAGSKLKAVNQFGKMIVPDYRGELELESKFGSLTAGKLSNVKEVLVEFGKADIQHINGGDLNIRFSSGTVNKLSGDIKSDLQFSQVKLNIDNDMKNLVLHNSYSSVYLDLDKNFSANWDVQTSHGEFSNKTAFAIKEQGGDDNKGYGPRFNKNYKGVSGGGAGKVKINSSFGEIVAGHDLQVDLDAKKKNKTRKSNSSSRVI